MSLTPEQIAEELAIAMFTLDGVCSPHDWVNANATARAHYRECARACAPIIKRIRNDALNEAAVICEQQAQDFLSNEYATNQPLSSIQERFACTTCANLIRQAKEPT